MNKIRLLFALEFISAGTILCRNCKGDYFISRTDDAFLNSPICISIPSGLEISGDFIRSRPDLYEIVTSHEPEKDSAIQELGRLEQHLTALPVENRPALEITARLKQLLTKIDFQEE